MKVLVWATFLSLNLAQAGTLSVQSMKVLNISLPSPDGIIQVVFSESQRFYTFKNSDSTMFGMIESSLLLDRPISVVFDNNEEGGSQPILVGVIANEAMSCTLKP